MYFANEAVLRSKSTFSQLKRDLKISLLHKPTGSLYRSASGSMTSQVSSSRTAAF